MSFRTYADQVRDDARGLHWRRINLRRCIDRLARRTGEPFADAVRRFDTAFGFQAAESAGPLLAPLAAVETERAELLAADQARKQTGGPGTAGV